MVKLHPRLQHPPLITSAAASGGRHLLHFLFVDLEGFESSFAATTSCLVLWMTSELKSQQSSCCAALRHHECKKIKNQVYFNDKRLKQTRNVFIYFYAALSKRFPMQRWIKSLRSGKCGSPRYTFGNVKPPPADWWARLVAVDQGGRWEPVGLQGNEPEQFSRRFYPRDD